MVLHWRVPGFKTAAHLIRVKLDNGWTFGRSDVEEKRTFVGLVPSPAPLDVGKVRDDGSFTLFKRRNRRGETEFNVFDAIAKAAPQPEREILFSSKMFRGIARRKGVFSQLSR